MTPMSSLMRLAVTSTPLPMDYCNLISEMGDKTLLSNFRNLLQIWKNWNIYTDVFLDRIYRTLNKQLKISFEEEKTKRLNYDSMRKTKEKAQADLALLNSVPVTQPILELLIKYSELKTDIENRIIKIVRLKIEYDQRKNKCSIELFKEVKKLEARKRKLEQLVSDYLKEVDRFNQ